MAAVVVGLSLTLAAAALECRQIAAEDLARFDAQRDRLVFQLEKRLRAYRFGLAGTRGVYAASKSVERGEFRAWAASRDLPVEFPGATAIGFIKHVARRDLDSFLAATRADEAPGFEVRTTDEGPSLMVAEFVEPVEANAAMVGFDWGQDAAVREVLLSAASTGDERATGLVGPDGPGGGESHVLLFMPIYRNGVPASTPEERAAALFGWAFMSLSPNEVFRGITEVVDGELDLHLFDGPPGSALVYDDDLCASAPNAVGLRTALSTLLPIEFGGRPWTASIAASDRFRAKGRGQVWWITLGGVALSLLTGRLFQVQAASLRRAERLADAMTVDLRRLAFVAQSTTNPVLITDARRRIVWVNDAFTRVRGYTLDEVKGKVPGQVFQFENTDPATVAAIRAGLDAGRPVHCQILNRHKSGRDQWMEVDIQPLHDRNGLIAGFAAVESDITDRLQAARASADARRLAEEASRAKSEFLANMSHEIRTPITAILGFADLLVEQSEDLPAPERLEHARTIRRNSEHLLNVINDILDISKIESGRLAVERIAVSPARVIAEVVSMMSVRAHEKGLMLSVEIADSTPALVLSDPVRLRQILVNLVGNAIKFTPAGTVSIRAGTGRDGRVGELWFEVLDTGIGLTSEQMGRIFQPFVQGDASTTRKFGGSGLGLVISQRLAAMLGGGIAVTSEPGKGSTFTLTLAAEALPEAPGAAAADERLAAPPDPMALAGARILLAEDTPDNQRLIAFHLRKAGADVHIVENGRRMVEALTACGTIDGPLVPSPPFDLVLTDVQMPDMDGLTAVRLLRRKGCGLPIASLTAHAMSGDADRCKAAGCDAYVPKPIDKAELVRTCRALLRERTRAAA